MFNKFIKFSEKELMAILSRGHLEGRDLLELKKALEQKGLRGMIMRVDGRGSRTSLKDIEEYHRFFSKIKKTKITLREIKEMENKLFSTTAESEEKKLALVTLAHLPRPEVLKILRRYQEKPDKTLVVWSALAYQECAMFLKNDLFAEEEISIMSLSGGKRGKMRFYFVFKTIEDEKVTPEIKRVMARTLFQVAEFFNGEVEMAKFGEHHVLAHVLLPFEVSPAEFSEGVVRVGNHHGFIWHRDFYVNNTHVPVSKEIEKFVENQPLIF